MIMSATPNTELLGEIVTWDIEGSTIGFAQTQAALVDAGLPDIAKELQPRSAFSRACKDLRDERAIDKLETANGVASFQFTKKVKAANLIDYDYECVVKLNLETGDIGCPENPELEKKATELFAHAMQSRSAQDITRLVQRLFQAHADLMPINPRKGVAYFVPEQHRDFTSKVDDFLRRLGGRLERFPVPKGTAQGNASVQAAVQNGLSTMLAELKETVGGFTESTREGTMAKMVERYQKVAYKVDAYAEYLGNEQEKLKAELEQARADLQAKILALHPADLGDESADGEGVAEEARELEEAAA